MKDWTVISGILQKPVNIYIYTLSVRLDWQGSQNSVAGFSPARWSGWDVELKFSKGLKNEDVQADKTPIDLMNGKQLITLLMEYSIGVRSIPKVLFNLEESSLGKL